LKPENLKSASEFQRELVKSVQDQIKAVEERGRSFLTLASGALAAVALVARPQDILTVQVAGWLRVVGNGALFVAVLFLVWAFLVYRTLALPSQVDFPNPREVQEIGEQDTEPSEIQQIILDGYTVLYEDALDLLLIKTARMRLIGALVLCVAVLLLMYWLSSAIALSFPANIPLSPSSPTTPIIRP
jgi:hypothetical protein